MSCTAVHLRSRSLNHCVTFKHDRRLLSLLGFVHNWPTSRWSATKKENRFSLNGNGIMSESSSGIHPVSSHSCCMYVLAGQPAFARPYVGVSRSTSLMSSSLLLQQSPACLVRLVRIVFVMGGRWPYIWWFVGCCCQDLFNIARNILV